MVAPSECVGKIRLLIPRRKYPPAYGQAATTRRQVAAVEILRIFNNHARGQAVANALMLQGALLSSDQIRAPHSLLEAFPELPRCLASDRVDDGDFK